MSKLDALDTLREMEAIADVVSLQLDRLEEQYEVLEGEDDDAADFVGAALNNLQDSLDNLQEGIQRAQMELEGL